MSHSRMTRSRDAEASSRDLHAADSAKVQVDGTNLGRSLQAALDQKILPDKAGLQLSILVAMRTKNPFDGAHLLKEDMWSALPTEICLQIMCDLDVFTLKALTEAYPKAKELVDYDGHRIISGITRSWPPQLRQIVLASLKIALVEDSFIQETTPSERSKLISELVQDTLNADDLDVGFFTEGEGMLVLNKLWLLQLESETAAKTFAHSRLSKTYNFLNDLGSFGRRRVSEQEKYRIYRAIGRLQIWHHLVLKFGQDVAKEVWEEEVDSFPLWEYDEYVSVELYFGRLHMHRIHSGAPKQEMHGTQSLYEFAGALFDTVTCTSLKVTRDTSITIRRRAAPNAPANAYLLSPGMTDDTLDGVDKEWQGMRGADKPSWLWTRSMGNAAPVEIPKFIYFDHFMARGLLFWDRERIWCTEMVDYPNPRSFCTPADSEERRRQIQARERFRQRHLEILCEEEAWLNAVTGFPSIL